MSGDATPGSATIRELLKAERWDELAQLLGPPVEGGEVPLELASAAYRANVKLGRADLAEAWLDRGLALAPANSTWQRDKGVLHQRRQEWPQALACFEKACTARPEIASYQGARAFALFQLGDHAGAAVAFRAALALDATNRAWWIRLARSLIHLDLPSEAVDAYGRALALQDDPTTRSARDELLRQVRSGSRSASAAYYDAVFADSAKYQKSGLETEYGEIWRRITTALGERGVSRVLDLGCGPGQFAEFVAAELPAISYTGIDFSGVAVSRARQRCPQYQFEKRELPISDFGVLPAFDAVVCTEVLEHVERDREILAALPEGVFIVASVPNFDSFGHLRLFRSEVEVRERYGILLRELTIQGIELSAQNTLWLMQGTRSGEELAAEANAKAVAVGLIDLAASAVESVLWSDGTRYVEDFLSQFGLPFVPVAESVGLDEPHVALRHDVDWSIENALAMASVEHQMGIRSSYYLLHPDGEITPANYFGTVEGSELVIDPRLFEWATRLLDLGHEVGLHNDLISLALVTRRQPREFLEQIVEAFAARGIVLEGSVAHGSRTCRDLGYMNYQIFSDFRDTPVAVDYRDNPELFERFARPVVERDGHVVPRFELRMSDFGLRYEANFVPREVYVYDSSARWTVWHESEVTRFERFESRDKLGRALAAALAAKRPRAAVQCLIHACHWSAMAHLNPAALPAVRKRRNQSFNSRYRVATLDRLRAFDNVLSARASERFAGYDKEYSAKRQLYKIGSTVSSFVDRLLEGAAASSSTLLEVGCGQGDLLALVHERLRQASPSRRIQSLGVDGSAAAIVACASRYAQVEWIADELEHFLEVHDEVAKDPAGAPRRYDLVLDKTGAIFIEEFDQARRFFGRLADVTRQGGLYVYIASRHYYDEVLAKQKYAVWPKDWLALAGEVFEPFLADDDDSPGLSGYYKRVFRKV